jgi:hypothetical protein
MNSFRPAGQTLRPVIRGSGVNLVVAENHSHGECRLDGFNHERKTT